MCRKWWRGDLSEEERNRDFMTIFSVLFQYVFQVLNMMVKKHLYITFSLFIFSSEIPNHLTSLFSTKKLVFDLFDHVLHIIFGMTYFLRQVS